ncbi:MAG: MFS transporter [Gammaproteobacteria bacterium]|nr:MFS transporter [Gammaproteobacteria bacterium]MDE0274186.1 MFS transporter [Gammaproteobacteria bacterium]
MPHTNLPFFFLAQVVFVSGSVLVVTLGGIVGSEMAPHPSLATLPLSLMVVGTALAAVPAALLMQRIGRRYGFACGALLAIGSALLAVLGLEVRSFALFTGAAGLIGATMAFGAQLRFAAAESVAPQRAGWAISIILLGSIGGAVIGPEMATRSPSWIPHQPYQGAFLALSALYVVALSLLLCSRNPVVASDAERDQAGRPLFEIAAQPAFIVAVLAGVIGQGVMVFIMTATPISMHVLDSHSIDATARVIQAHVVAMYLPSLVSAPLIQRFGAHRLMIAGVGALGIAVAVGLAGRELMHYWWALVLLGVGWNFLFVGGTTALVATYRPTEKFRAQALNDFSIFGVSAVASLMAGALLHGFGWSAVLLSTLPALALMLLAIVYIQAHGRQTAIPRAGRNP